MCSSDQKVNFCDQFQQQKKGNLVKDCLLKASVGLPANSSNFFKDVQAVVLL
jgi:hypothetical protein